MFSKILSIVNMELILSLELFVMNFHCENWPILTFLENLTL